MEKRDLSLQRMRLHCSRVQWRRALHHCIQMLWIALADVWLGCSCSAMETHSMELSKHCSWANLKATWSLEVCSDWLCRKLASAHYAPQHLLTLRCHFTWPTTSWLSCCRSQSFPLCYNTTDSGTYQTLHTCHIWWKYSWFNIIGCWIINVTKCHAHRCMKFGMHMYHYQTRNKPSRTHTLRKSAILTHHWEFCHQLVPIPSLIV